MFYFDILATVILLSSTLKVAAAGTLALTYSGYSLTGSITLNSSTVSGSFQASATSNATVYTGSIHLTGIAFNSVGAAVGGFDTGDLIVGGYAHCSGSSAASPGPSYAVGYFTFNNKVWERNVSL